MGYQLWVLGLFYDFFRGDGEKMFKVDTILEMGEGNLLIIIFFSNHPPLKFNIFYISKVHFQATLQIKKAINKQFDKIFFQKMWKFFSTV